MSGITRNRLKKMTCEQMTGKLENVVFSRLAGLFLDLGHLKIK